MLQAFFNMWRIAELRSKILFTLGMLAIYRIGFFIPLPAVNQEALAKWAKNLSGSAAGNLVQYMQTFTGGSLGQSTIFSLGIMPYISASIVFQLLVTVLPSLQQIQKEGPAGRQKIQEWTRYATIAFCLVQAIFWLSKMQHDKLVYANYSEGFNFLIFWICGLVGLTGGTIFLMWLGEQIDKYGIGNGVSLIITAGIVARMPRAVYDIYSQFDYKSGASSTYTPLSVLFLAAAFIAVVAGAIIITQGQRRIPIQQAKHTRGRRVYGGQKTYLPLRVNHGGVMPIIFASSLMIFPALLIGYFNGVAHQPSPEHNNQIPQTVIGNILQFLNDQFHGERGYVYVVLYIGLIYFFAYFWTTVQFQPKEMATQLRDHGSFIPGLRPGPRTAEYLEVVMERITYVGAGFLAVIAIIPSIVHGVFSVDYVVSSFLGGTGLLIVVSVMLDFVQRIEASMMMRNYSGFLGGGSGGKGPRIRGPRGGT